MQTDNSSPINEEPLMTVEEVVGYDPEQLMDASEFEPETIKVKRGTYEAYAASPSQENLYALVKTLNPTIGSVLSRYGVSGDPHLQAKARILTAKAIQSYSPDSGASLPTWVSSQLQGIAREKRKSQNPISVPEGVQLDAYAIERATLELEDKLNREPTVNEIADKIGLSVKRIADVRNKMFPVTSDAPYDNDENSILPGVGPNYNEEALDYVYADADYVDKKLIEHAIGYGGAKILSPAEIRQKLKLSPVSMSRRRYRIGEKIKEISELLEQNA